MTRGRQDPEKVPIRLETLRSEEEAWGGREESVSSSDTRFLASLMTDRSTPLPLTAPCWATAGESDVRVGKKLIITAWVLYMQGFVWRFVLAP